MQSSASLGKVRSLPDDPELLPSLVELLESVGKELDGDREIAKSLLRRATSLIRVHIDRHALGEEATRGSGLAGWQTRRLLLFIEARLDQPIQIKELSAIAKLSKAHFSRAFKRAFNSTPHSYIIRRRLEKAEALMLTSDLSLSDIAFHCGLTDQAHLCKLFRQKYGESPAAWRRERTETDSRKSKSATRLQLNTDGV
jgi:AraC family transcriptional regulator